MLCEPLPHVVQQLASTGGHTISGKELGIMIGEIFAIQHDINLHSEILDVPDFFWNEEKKCTCLHESRHCCV